MNAKTSNMDNSDETSPVSHISLVDKSRQELVQLAWELSNGNYKKDSAQRRRILQMIADKLFNMPEGPP